MEGKRFSINGIKVTATHLGGGLYVGIPDNLGEALKALKTLLSGALFEPRDIQLLPDEPRVTTPPPRLPPPPSPTSPTRRSWSTASARATASGTSLT